jgi:hypothetical protein
MPVSTRARAVGIDTDGEDITPDVEELVSALKGEEPEVKEVWVQDEGEWVKKKLHASDVPEVRIDFDESATDLLPSWYEGRGQEMEHKWLNIDSRYSMAQLQKGWRPVRPEHYQDVRYTVKKTANLGEIITFMDIFLAEMPRERAEEIRRRVGTRLTNERVARIFGITQDTETLKDATGGLAQIIQEKGQIGLEAETLSQLPFDSPMAREARTLVDRLQADKERTLRANARR